MTQTIAVDKNNDMYIDANGNLAIVFGLQATLQACAQAAKAQLGEMVLATDQGIPYFQQVWIGVPNLQQFEAALRSAFLGVSGVIEVVSLSLSQTSNTLSYTAVIRTIYGAGAING
jgi:hypothetical protein